MKLFGKEFKFNGFDVFHMGNKPTKTDVGLGSVDNTADSAKNVLSATKFTTARTINGVSFNGTANITVADSTKEPSFTKNTGFNKAFGTTVGTVAQGNDSRFTDARNPLSHTHIKSEVGLGNVDNTTDLLKPVSTATTNALALKANLASPTFTGTVGGITASMVGLGNVNNTADSVKPVSTAQQTALNLKANLASPSLTGIPLAPTASAGTNTTQIATTAYVQSAMASVGAGDMLKSVYDTNGDGIVNKSHDADTLDGKHSSDFLLTSGGIINGKVNIQGTASSQPLQIRGIVGSDGLTTVTDLYLQYGANAKIMLGNTGAYTISSDGGTYSGISSSANSLISTFIIDGGTF